MASNGGTSGSNGSAPQPHVNPGLPKDALVMSAILKEMGVTEYEPQVINQMLELTYRHVTTILDEARVLSDHAGKSAIDAQDAKLAISMVAEHAFMGPPPQEFMLELAKEKNEKPLPPIAEKNGQRLPAERYCLLANNFQIKHVKPTKGSSSSRSHHHSSSSSASTSSQLPTPAPSVPLQVRLPSPSGNGQQQLLTIKTPVMLSTASDASLVARTVSSGSTVTSMSRASSSNLPSPTVPSLSVPVVATPTLGSSPPPPTSTLEDVGRMVTGDVGGLEEDMPSGGMATGDVTLDSAALGLGVKRRRSDDDDEVPMSL